MSDFRTYRISELPEGSVSRDTLIEIEQTNSESERVPISTVEDFLARHEGTSNTNLISAITDLENRTNGKITDLDNRKMDKFRYTPPTETGTLANIAVGQSIQLLSFDTKSTPILGSDTFGSIYFDNGYYISWDGSNYQIFDGNNSVIKTIFSNGVWGTDIYQFPTSVTVNSITPINRIGIWENSRYSYDPPSIIINAEDLYNLILQEQQNRISGDNTLTSRIEAEENTARSAESGLENRKANKITVTPPAKIGTLSTVSTGQTIDIISVPEQSSYNDDTNAYGIAHIGEWKISVSENTISILLSNGSQMNLTEDSGSTWIPESISMLQNISGNFTWENEPIDKNIAPWDMITWSRQDDSFIQDLSDVKNELDVKKEDVVNKVSVIDTNEPSTTRYTSEKSVYDYLEQRVSAIVVSEYTKGYCFGRLIHDTPLPEPPQEGWDMTRSAFDFTNDTPYTYPLGGSAWIEGTPISKRNGTTVGITCEYIDDGVIRKGYAGLSIWSDSGNEWDHYPDRTLNIDHDTLIIRDTDSAVQVTDEFDPLRLKAKNEDITVAADNTLIFDPITGKAGYGIAGKSKVNTVNFIDPDAETKNVQIMHVYDTLDHLQTGWTWVDQNNRTHIEPQLSTLLREEGAMVLKMWESDTQYGYHLRIKHPIEEIVVQSLSSTNTSVSISWIVDEDCFVDFSVTTNLNGMIDCICTVDDSPFRALLNAAVGSVWSVGNQKVLKGQTVAIGATQPNSNKTLIITKILGEYAPANAGY